MAAPHGQAQRHDRAGPGAAGHVDLAAVLLGDGAVHRPAEVGFDPPLADFEADVEEALQPPGVDGVPVVADLAWRRAPKENAR